MSKLTITEMKKRNEEAGFHWFKKDTMEYFGTVIEAKPNKDNIFITSEWADFEYSKRKYTLRKYNTETNNVETTGEFLAYETLEEAREARKELSDTEKKIDLKLLR